LLQRPREHLPLWRRLCWGGLAVSLLCAAGLAALDRWGGEPGQGLRLLRGALFRLQPLALAIAYAAAFTLLFLRPRGARVLGMLAPVGRMALSHYLVQSVLGIA